MARYEHGDGFSVLLWLISSPVSQIKAMGQVNKILDQADLTKLSMKGEFMPFRKESATLRTDVLELQEDVQSISTKQGEISLLVDAGERATHHFFYRTRSHTGTL